MITALNIITLILGATFTILASKRLWYSNIALIAATIGNMLICMNLGLYADFGKELLITLPLAVHSLVSWRTCKDDTEKGKPQDASKVFNIKMGFALLAQWGILFLILGNFQENHLLINSLIVSVSTTYFIYHSKMYRQAWFFSITKNCLYVIQFALIWGNSLDLQVMIVKNVVFASLALKGLYDWTCVMNPEFKLLESKIMPSFAFFRSKQRA